MASFNEEEVPRFVEKLLRAHQPEITKDMGLISLKAGIIIQKKFKFYGEKGQVIQVYSDQPVIVQIKTPELTLDKEDGGKGYSVVRF